LNLSAKVEGSMLGKSLSATGRRSSMNGMMTKTENGMRRRRSWVVRLSCCDTERGRQGQSCSIVVARREGEAAAGAMKEGREDGPDGAPCE